jgi:hypothetical protein
VEGGNGTSGLRHSVHVVQCADEDGDSETRPCDALVSHARHQFVTFVYIYLGRLFDLFLRISSAISIDIINSIHNTSSTLLLSKQRAISHNSLIKGRRTTRVRMNDLTHILLGSILHLLHQDMTRDHHVVRAYPRQRRRINHRVQRVLKATTRTHRAPATAPAPTQPPATGPSYRSMEPSPPHPMHFTPAVRSDDLDRFYGRIVGVAPLSTNDGAGRSQVRASTPPEGGVIIDLNISATTPPSSTPTTTDLNPNMMQIRSPPPNPNPNGSPPRLSLLGN